MHFLFLKKKRNRKEEELCAILKEKKDEKDKFDFNEQKGGCWVYPSANDLGKWNKVQILCLIWKHFLVICYRKKLNSIAWHFFQVAASFYYFWHSNFPFFYKALITKKLGFHFLWCVWFWHKIVFHQKRIAVPNHEAWNEKINQVLINCKIQVDFQIKKDCFWSYKTQKWLYQGQKSLTIFMRMCYLYFSFQKTTETSSACQNGFRTAGKTVTRLHQKRFEKGF